MRTPPRRPPRSRSSRDVPDDLPLLRADERRLQPGAANLLSNAVKFTEAGGTVIGRRRRWRPTGRLLLFVRDTGIGIAEEDIDARLRAVHPARLHRCRAASRARASASMCRGPWSQAHGGELSLRSAPGAGTTAEIRLPAESG